MRLETMADWEFIESALATHNHWRRRHGVPDLHYNRDLERLAQAWAVHLANTGEISGSTNLYLRRPLGENICIRTSRHGEDYTGREVSDTFYRGVVRYDFQTHTGQDTGQFSQMVWRETEEMGIGKAYSDDGSCVVVANYYPPGNIEGHYPFNVQLAVDGKVILPGDDTIKKVVKTDKTREIINGVPYLKTTITETTVNPDGTRSVVTKQSMDSV